MIHTQPPILAVAKPVSVEVRAAEGPKSLWLQEAEVAARGALMARELALELPQESEVRARLLARADDWLMLASLRGVRPVRPSEARSQTG